MWLGERIYLLKSVYSAAAPCSAPQGPPQILSLKWKLSLNEESEESQWRTPQKLRRWRVTLRPPRRWSSQHSCNRSSRTKAPSHRPLILRSSLGKDFIIWKWFNTRAITESRAGKEPALLIYFNDLLKIEDFSVKFQLHQCLTASVDFCLLLDTASWPASIYWS